MATILPDREIKKLLGICILDGSEDNIKPNSYELRLGNKVRFHSTDEPRELEPDQYLEIHPGELVTVNSFEKIDFSRKTVQKVYPNHLLLGFITPTTTMMREGVSLTATKIDAGFKGDLNWGIRHSSIHPTVLKCGERLFKLTIYKLGPEESADTLYGERPTDFYQETEGIKVSARTIPADIPKSKIVSRDPKKLDPKKQLKEAGYPYSHIGTELVALDGKFEIVSKDVALLKQEFEKQAVKLSDKIDKESISLSEKMDEMKNFLSQKFESYVDKKHLSLYGYIIAISVFLLALLQYLKEQPATLTQALVLIGVGVAAIIITRLLARGSK